MHAQQANGNDWTHLDGQLRAYGPLLRDDLKICIPASDNLATTIAAEIHSLPSTKLESLVADDPIPPQARLEELTAFQCWMDMACATQQQPAVVRAQVIVQNYICFVYLGDALFKALRKISTPGSVTRKCCKYLTDNPARAFRNAIAHANWRYMPDFSGLQFWARKGPDPSETMTRYEVKQRELAFWQMLARAVAYVAYTEIKERDE